MAETNPALKKAPEEGRLTLSSEKVAIVALFILAMLQVELVFSKSINWDEFFHFSQIHAARRGEHIQWLQTPHIWLFRWVPALAGDAIDHIRLIRLMVLGCELGTAALLWRILRHRYEPTVALLGAITYISGGYVFLHGFALRPDMIAAFLLMAAIAVLVIRPLRIAECIVIAIFLALAFVATIKSVLWLPALLGALIYRREHLPLKKIAVYAGLIIIAAIAASLLSPMIRHAALDIIHLADNSVSRMFNAGLFPQQRYLLHQLISAPLLTLLVVCGVWCVVQPFTKGADRIASALFIAPLLSLVLYRNAFPYFFPFIVPAAVIAAAPAGKWLVQRRRYGLGLIAALSVIAGFMLSVLEDRTVLSRQQLLIAAVHEVFPEPVRYIDDVGIISDFPRAVPRFASGWALEGYIRKGRPDYRLSAMENTVPLLVRDGPVFFPAAVRRELFDNIALLAADRQFIAENFIEHWGSLYVAGTHMEASPSATSFEIIAPGTYTLELGKLMIDEASYEPGDTIRLARGTHLAGPRSVPVSLRWGDHLPIPSASYPDGRLFTEY